MIELKRTQTSDEMDGDIMRWMLEFLLRECTNGGLVTSLLSNVRLPFPADDNSRVKKTIVLRSIQDELECTLRSGLKEAVDRIWKLRIQRLVGKSELVTGEVPRLRLEVEMAITDLNAHMAVQKWRKKHNALKLVQDYLNEAFGVMGPSFLQLVARQQMETKSHHKSGNQNGDSSGGRVNGIVNGEEHVCNDDGSGYADLDRPECEVIPNMNGKSYKPEEGPVDVLDGTLSVEEHLCDVVGDGPKGSQDVDDSRPQNKDKLNRKKKDINSDIPKCSSGKVAGSMTGKEQVCKVSGCEPVELPDAGGREEGEDTIKKIEKKRRRKGASASDKRKHVSRCHGPVKIADVGESDETGDLYVESRDGKNASASATSNQGVPVVQGGKDVVSPPYQVPISLTSASDKGKHGPAKIADVDETRDLFVESKDGEVVEASTTVTSNQGVPVAQGGKDVHSPQCPIPTSRASEAGNKKPALDKQNEKDLDAEATENVNDKGDGSVSSAGNRLQMETHRRLPVYPLKKYEELNLLHRRKKRKWSLEEETALINGVQQFGPGAWKDILSSRRDQFDNRSDVDLKDKWRNMTKYKH
ncbi:Telomere repeat-binding factor 5 [Linum grandiflorum]